MVSPTQLSSTKRKRKSNDLVWARDGDHKIAHEHPCYLLENCNEDGAPSYDKVWVEWLSNGTVAYIPKSRISTPSIASSSSQITTSAYAYDEDTDDEIAPDPVHSAQVKEEEDLSGEDTDDEDGKVAAALTPLVSANVKNEQVNSYDMETDDEESSKLDAPSPVVSSQVKNEEVNSYDMDTDGEDDTLETEERDKNASESKEGEEVVFVSCVEKKLTKEEDEQIRKRLAILQHEMLMHEKRIDWLMQHQLIQHYGLYRSHIIGQQPNPIIHSGQYNQSIQPPQYHQEQQQLSEERRRCNEQLVKDADERRKKRLELLESKKKVKDLTSRLSYSLVKDKRHPDVIEEGMDDTISDSATSSDGNLSDIGMMQENTTHNNNGGNLKQQALDLATITQQRVSMSPVRTSPDSGIPVMNELDLQLQAARSPQMGQVGAPKNDYINKTEDRKKIYKSHPGRHGDIRMRRAHQLIQQASHYGLHPSHIIFGHQPSPMLIQQQQYPSCTLDKDADERRKKRLDVNNVSTSPNDTAVSMTSMTANISVSTTGSITTQNDPSPNETTKPKAGERKMKLKKHPGRNGDIRMRRAFEARQQDPKMPLMAALLHGGFIFPQLYTPGVQKSQVKDTEGVTVYQRKNQLNRRLREAKADKNKINNEREKMRKAKKEEKKAKKEEEMERERSRREADRLVNLLNRSRREADRLVDLLNPCPFGL